VGINKFRNYPEEIQSPFRKKKKELGLIKTKTSDSDEEFDSNDGDADAVLQPLFDKV